MKGNMMELKDLAGEAILEGVPNTDARHPIDADALGVIFELSGKTYLVFEDPNDGYRSCAAPIMVFDGPAYQLGGDSWSRIYFKEDVICSHKTKGDHGNEDDILEIASKETGQVLLRVGTADIDDYYPGFVCEWNPAGLSQNSKTRATD